MFFELSEALQNYLLIISGLVGIIMIPLTGINTTVQLLSTEERNEFLQEYYSWRLGFDIQILVIMFASIFYLHIITATLIVANVLIWYIGDFIKGNEEVALWSISTTTMLTRKPTRKEGNRWSTMEVLFVSLETLRPP